MKKTTVAAAVFLLSATGFADAGRGRHTVAYCRSNTGNYAEMKVEVVQRNGRPYALAGHGVESTSRSTPRSVTFGGVISDMRPVRNGVLLRLNGGTYRYMDGGNQRLSEVIVYREADGSGSVQLAVNNSRYTALGCDLRTIE